MSVHPISSAAAGMAPAAMQGLATRHPPGLASKIPGAAAEAPPTPTGGPSMAEVQQALADVQEVIRPVAQDLLFSIDKDSGKTIVKIVDSSTDQVIRQIPSEELLAIAKALDKFQGLLLKQQV